MSFSVLFYTFLMLLFHPSKWLMWLEGLLNTLGIGFACRSLGVIPSTTWSLRITKSDLQHKVWNYPQSHWPWPPNKTKLKSSSHYSFFCCCSLFFFQSTLSYAQRLPLWPLAMCSGNHWCLGDGMQIWCLQGKCFSLCTILLGPQIYHIKLLFFK